MPDRTHTIGNIYDEGYAKKVNIRHEYDALGRYVERSEAFVLKPFWCTDIVPYQYQSHQASNGHDHDEYSTGYKTIYVPYSPGMTTKVTFSSPGGCYPAL